MRGKIIFLFSAFILAAALFSVNVMAAEATVCCEKTTSGLFCQDAPISQCDSTSPLQKAPTSCKTTSYCRLGTCYDSKQGICMDKTPQKTCNANGGTWSDSAPAACTLGCCVLGDQAAFVTLVRCKKLSGDLGLTTNYKKNIKDETACVMSVKGQEKGACVYESDFERTCKLTTRADCGTANKTLGRAEFFPGLLCSAETLGTNCGPTSKTTCLPGKEGVYFVDSCGNAGNIYDASKLIDTAYWTRIVDPANSCSLKISGPGANAATCGNCDYLAGSICRTNTQGTSLCVNLNCPSTITSDKQNHVHGESWCVNDEATTGVAKNKVGSRFFKHTCINGEDVVEPCADYRAEECIQTSIPIVKQDGTAGTFSQAGCKVNKWQFCTSQDNKDDCENPDKGDCLWVPGNGVIYSIGNSTTGACVPKNSPGLKFSEAGDAKGICAQASFTCTVRYEKDILSMIEGGEGSCQDNCECLTTEWADSRKFLCEAMGDCGGTKTNYLGFSGPVSSVKNPLIN